MIYLLQNIIAQRSVNGGAWIQLLIVVVIFVSYAVKTMLNARKSLSKQDSEAQEQHQQERSGGRRDRYQSLAEIRAEQIAQVRLAQQPQQPKRSSYIAPHAGPVRFSVSQSPRHEQFTGQEALSAAIGYIAARDEDADNLPAKTTARRHHPKPEKADLKAKLRQSENKVSGSISDEPQPEGVFDAAVSFEDPRNIRDAIIYSEIISKPVALR